MNGEASGMAVASGAAWRPSNEAACGDDRLRDFENGHDRIDLRAFDGLAFADLTITTGAASGGPGTLVEIDAATSLRLPGIPAGYLDAGDFLFA